MKIRDLRKNVSTTLNFKSGPVQLERINIFNGTGQPVLVDMKFNDRIKTLFIVLTEKDKT